MNRAVLQRLDDEKITQKEELEDKLFGVSAFYRISGYTIEEIKERVKKDPNLVPNSSVTI